MSLWMRYCCKQIHHQHHHGCYLKRFETAYSLLFRYGSWHLSRWRVQVYGVLFKNGLKQLLLPAVQVWLLMLIPCCSGMAPGNRAGGGCKYMGCCCCGPRGPRERGALQRAIYRVGGSGHLLGVCCNWGTSSGRSHPRSQRPAGLEVWLHPACTGCFLCFVFIVLAYLIDIVHMNSPTSLVRLIKLTAHGTMGTSWFFFLN